MTKDQFIKWVQQYRRTHYYVRLVTERVFTDAELDWLANHIVGLKLKASVARKLKRAG